jgi:hypothetical protein
MIPTRAPQGNTADEAPFEGSGIEVSSWPFVRAAVEREAGAGKTGRGSGHRHSSAALGVTGWN